MWVFGPPNMGPTLLVIVSCCGLVVLLPLGIADVIFGIYDTKSRFKFLNNLLGIFFFVLLFSKIPEQ